MGKLCSKAVLAGVAATVSTGILAGVATAAAVIYEPFNYTTGERLIGQVNGSATWTDPTAPGQPAAASDTQTILGTSVAHAGLATYGGSLNLPNTPHGNMAFLPFPTAYFSDGGVGNAPDGVFMSAAIKFGPNEGNTSVSGWFTGFNFNNTGGMSTANGYGGMVWIKRDTVETTKYLLGISKNNAAGFSVAWTSQKFDVNETAFLVMRYKFNTTANNTDDTASLWVNPNLLAPMPVPTVESSTGFDVYTQPTSPGPFFSNLKSVVVRSNGLSGTNNLPTDLVYDELRVGLSYGDVLPEPASLGLLTLGGLALVRRRRTA